MPQVSLSARSITYQAFYRHCRRKVVSRCSLSLPSYLQEGTQQYTNTRPVVRRQQVSPSCASRRDTTRHVQLFDDNKSHRVVRQEDTQQGTSSCSTTTIHVKSHRAVRRSRTSTRHRGSRCELPRSSSCLQAAMETRRSDRTFSEQQFVDVSRSPKTNSCANMYSIDSKITKPS